MDPETHAKEPAQPQVEENSVTRSFQGTEPAEGTRRKLVRDIIAEYPIGPDSRLAEYALGLADKIEEALLGTEEAASHEYPPAEPPSEASPGVPLVQPPGTVVTYDMLEAFGEVANYLPIGEGIEPLEATTYAFAPGTAIETGTDSGQLATSQASRIVRNGTELGIVPNDVFNQSYEPAPAPQTEEDS